MTTFYTTRVLEPLQRGVKQTRNYDSFPLAVQVGSKVNSLENSHLPKKGRVSTLLLGSRSRNIESYEAGTYQGRIVNIDSTSNRKYSLLKEIGTGKRITWFTGGSFFSPETQIGKRVTPQLTGVGAYGIGYTPTITATQDNRIRRWPREWHGENMN